MGMAITGISIGVCSSDGRESRDQNAGIRGLRIFSTRAQRVGAGIIHGDARCGPYGVQSTGMRQYPVRELHPS